MGFKAIIESSITALVFYDGQIERRRGLKILAVIEGFSQETILHGFAIEDKINRLHTCAAIKHLIHAFTAIAATGIDVRTPDLGSRKKIPTIMEHLIAHPVLPVRHFYFRRSVDKGGTTVKHFIHTTTFTLRSGNFRRVDQGRTLIKHGGICITWY